VAARAGPPRQDTGFVEDHPAGIYRLGDLISGRSPGEGGFLLNGKGECFMEYYAPGHGSTPYQDDRGIVPKRRGCNGQVFRMEVRVHRDARMLSLITWAVVPPRAHWSGMEVAVVMHEGSMKKCTIIRVTCATPYAGRVLWLRTSMSDIGPPNLGLFIRPNVRQWRPRTEAATSTTGKMQQLAFADIDPNRLILRRR
jgi:hypothetical protein